jgi:hypothetical protein
MSIPTTNEITGDYLLSKASTDNYRTNYDAIFCKKRVDSPTEAATIPAQEIIPLEIESAPQQEKTVAVPLKVILEWRQEWMDANDPCSGEDCVSPFDKYIY